MDLGSLAFGNGTEAGVEGVNEFVEEGFEMVDLRGGHELSDGGSGDPKVANQFLWGSVACSVGDIGGNAVGRLDHLLPDGVPSQRIPLQHHSANLVRHRFRKLINPQVLQVPPGRIDPPKAKELRPKTFSALPSLGKRGVRHSNRNLLLGICDLLGRERR